MEGLGAKIRMIEVTRTHFRIIDLVGEQECY